MARRQRQRLDVGPGVDGRVPRQTPGRGAHQRTGIAVGRGVLDDRVGKGRQDPLVDGAVGRILDEGATVVGLEVEHPHAARGGHVGDQRRVPFVRGIELELRSG